MSFYKQMSAAMTFYFNFVYIILFPHRRYPYFDVAVGLRGQMILRAMQAVA
jgi:hypothetical protein